MKASTTTVQNILEGTKQYVIPLFQRSYSWGKDEWATLWNDVKDLYENSDMQHHFVGSIVTIPDTSFPDGVAKYLLIDGQQRITTLIILLSALRDYCRDIIHDEKEANLIHNTFLCNTYYDGSDYLKLSPSGFDYPFFDSKIRMIDIKGNHRINDAYNFFSSSLKRQGIRVPELRRIIVNGLQLVSIVLDADDNPHLVFESLNAKGLPLTQTDLIRNYFLMQMSPAEQEVLYRNIWLKMDSALGDQFEIFIRDFLMYRLGKDIKPADIYITVKKNFQSENVSIILHDMMRLMNLYNWLITPDILEDFELQRAFQRLKKLEVPSINPFILHCLDDFEHGELSRTDLLNCIHIIENFLMRRYVCNLGTAQLHKFFPILHTQANEFGDKFVDGLRFILQSKGYPKDAEFKTYLVQAQLFKAGGHRTSQKTRLLLESIEESYHHKEQVMLSNTTIEHIMPQTLYT
ncbi:DUF262 domain-containing protein [Ferroacidibacillus organovorans]|uniref:DUF262 domain-containing protein n=1 Tax=Ferroacidibacillus organovorans TaxID=1765683 RepID=UPI0007A7F55F|nr:DUF262 domain-containing protein [Ferroacidibacillus organovorans]KYP82009.1 hypothetical protein AYJ22_15535 [Ferroacidibacillus organovorans]